MKKVLLYTLCMVMLLTCFTACKQDAKPTTPESKTDVSTPAVVDQQPKEEVQAEVDVSEPAQEEEKEPVQQSDDEQDETEPVSKVESKPTSKVESKPASKVESKPATSQEKEDDDQDAIVDPVEPEPLSFASSGEFANWLKNGNTFVDERNEFVAQTQANNVVTYYRPKMMTDDRYHGGFSVHQPSLSLDYTIRPYDSTKELQIHVSVGMKQIDKIDDWFANAKKQYESNNGQYLYLKTPSGIEFYYSSAPSKLRDTVSVYWQQFGITHTAGFNRIGNDFENLPQLIPLLELEQVTVKLNDDAVIK